ncbi:IPT/TIG domain-containing protein [Streptomyces sp. NPDC048430]|uniref:IPT/TIG domain-containing protein n=1 Tax=unclassified Streptomyces TaxID=2593676 RepID=UPI0034131F81
MSVAVLLPPVLTQPNLFAAVPGFGPTTGGNVVLLIGANLGGATSVTFGGTPATIVSQDPLGILLTVIAPAHAAGNVPVVVTAGAVASTPANYTYVAVVTPPPIVLAITPPSGPVAGGSAFTIIGANLTGASVSFGGVPATNVNVLAGVLLTGVTPPGPAGLVSVQVTTAGGTTTVPGGFTYVGSALPSAVSITPASGPAAGGTPFAITGSHLVGATVTIGGAAATNVVIDPTGVVLAGVTPAGTVGNAAVVVTTAAGTSTVPGGFTYA